MPRRGLNAKTLRLPSGNLKRRDSASSSVILKVDKSPSERTNSRLQPSPVKVSRSVRSSYSSENGTLGGRICASVEEENIKLTDALVARSLFRSSLASTVDARMFLLELEEWGFEVAIRSAQAWPLKCCHVIKLLTAARTTKGEWILSRLPANCNPIAHRST